MVDSFEGRVAMLSAGHVAPLEAWRSRIASGRPVPHFDPLDGGIAASLLILLETPAASRHYGEPSLRFVSRDNPSGTQRNLSRFLDDAGIARRQVLLWNAVPWVVHAPGSRNRPLRRAEIREGLATLPGLLTLLPRLTTIALAGRIAREAAPTIAEARPEIAIVAMPHPSPANVCTSSSVVSSIQAALATAARLMGEEQR